MRSHSARFFRNLAAVVLVALACLRPAAAANDYTDLWWNANESGWGANFIQADDFIFVTFFIYDAALQPTWYSAQMTRASNGVWSGPLFLTSGSWFGAPWNPAQRTTTQVGSVTFTPLSVTAGTLAYNVGTINVTKSITRQTLKTIAVGGGYLGGIYGDVFNCQNPLLNQTYRAFADFAVIQNTNGQLQIDFAVQGGGTCSMRGASIQQGQLFRIPNAAYTCTNGLSTTANVTHIKATMQGFEGQWVAAVNFGCTEEGYWSAVLK
jgi:hypothetical protein